MTSAHPVAGISVYVLREKLHESWEKRESLRKQEEQSLREVVPSNSRFLREDGLYEKALDTIIEGTQGFDNLRSWRSRFLPNQG